MSPHEYSIALRIRHPSIDPNEITRHLGFIPQHEWRAGEPREMGADEIGSSTHLETYWLGLLPTRELAPSLAHGPLATVALIKQALTAFKRSAIHPLQFRLYLTLLKMKRDAAFWREFAEQGGTVECLLQVHETDRFQLDLSPTLLLAFVELKIPLSIEVDGGLRAAA